jgi:hypothetical protein
MPRPPPTLRSKISASVGPRVKTARFGVVPLVLTNYNAGTLVATLKLAPGWVLSFSSGVLTVAGTDIQAEIQAVTTLYAAEKVTVFSGNGINARGVHIENPGVVTTLAECAAGFGGDPWSSYILALQPSHRTTGFPSRGSQHNERAIPYVPPQFVRPPVDDLSGAGGWRCRSVVGSPFAQRLLSGR